MCGRFPEAAGTNDADASLHHGHGKITDISLHDSAVKHAGCFASAAACELRARVRGRALQTGSR